MRRAIVAWAGVALIGIGIGFYSIALACAVVGTIVFLDMRER